VCGVGGGNLGDGRNKSRREEVLQEEGRKSGGGVAWGKEAVAGFCSFDIKG